MLSVSVQFSGSVLSKSLQHHELQHAKPPCPSSTPGACECVLVAQSCLTLYDPVDCSQPGFSVYRILQTRVLEWVAISFSIHLSVCLCVCVYVSCSVMSDSLWHQGWYPTRLFCPWDSPGKSTGVGCHSFSIQLKLMSVELVMTSNHLMLCLPLLLLLSIFPSIRDFSSKSGGQHIGVSASVSVLPMNNQDWSPLGWTGWISLQSKGLTRVFSNTTVQKHRFFRAQLSL